MRNPTMWKVAAVVVLAIAMVNVMLGTEPAAWSVRGEREGHVRRPVITWAMVLISAGSGLALAGYPAGGEAVSACGAFARYANAYVNNPIRRAGDDHVGPEQQRAKTPTSLSPPRAEPASGCRVM